MKFKIIKKRKNPLGLISNSQWIVFTIFFLTLLSGQISKYFSELLLYISIFIIFAAIIYSVLDYEKLNADIVGEFILEEEYLQIHTDQILYNEIKNFEIETNFYKGQLRFFGSSYFFQAFNYVGKNNFFKIQLNDQKLLEGEFQIESERDLKRINEKYASLLLNEKIHLYSHSLHKVPLSVKQTSSFLMYLIKLKEQEIIGKDYANRVLKR